jgi:acetate kinase
MAPTHLGNEAMIKPMRALAINFGTATLKFGLYAGGVSEPLVHGVLEGTSHPEQAIARIHQVVGGHGAVNVIAHRVVHGGVRYTAPVVVDAIVERELEGLVPLAPLHNTMALIGIRAGRANWPGVPQVAVFDTAFHASMPEHAARYAVPAAWEEAGLRRYGFHGLSHQHVMEACADRLSRPSGELRIVSCHLGSGASVCAIDGGHSVDTSMGLTPLEGVVMATRSGDLDPGAVGFLVRTLGMSQEDIEQSLYRDSGLKAWAGRGGDLREIEAAALDGDPASRFALDAYAYRIRKYIGAYAAALGGVDAIAFTGGVGENAPAIRSRVLSGLGFLGVRLDAAANADPWLDSADTAAVHAPGAQIPLILVRAKEEWQVARQALELLARR